MVRDVRETIANILKQHFGLYINFIYFQKIIIHFIVDIPNIDEYMKSLETSRRYLLDIWS
jgi:hypothetical protein